MRRELKYQPVWDDPIDGTCLRCFFTTSAVTISIHVQILEIERRSYHWIVGVATPANRRGERKF